MTAPDRRPWPVRLRDRLGRHCPHLVYAYTETVERMVVDLARHVVLLERRVADLERRVDDLAARSPVAGPHHQRG